MSIPLPPRIGQPATCALAAVGITSLEEVCRLTEQELAAMHGVGPKALGVLKQCLNEHNMHLQLPKRMKPKKSEIVDG